MHAERFWYGRELMAAGPGNGDHPIVRATDANFTQNVLKIQAGASATSYTDSAVVPGQTYYYELIAVNSAGQSAPTQAVTTKVG